MFQPFALKNIVPELWVKVPLFEYVPPMDSRLGTVTAPEEESIVKFDVEALSANILAPPRVNMT